MNATVVGMNLLAQSTLLIAVGLLASSLLRSRGAALQCAVLRMTLVAVVVCPLLAFALAQAGVKGLVLQLPGAGETVEPASAPSAAVSTIHAPLQATPAFAAPVPQPAISEGPLAKPTAHSLDVSWKNVLAALAAAWGLGAVVLLARLFSAHLWMLSVRRHSSPAPDTVQKDCERLAMAMGCGVPDVRTTRRIKSPCLTGILRPLILLPESEVAADPAGLHEVLLHELAHFARRDCAWNLLARIVQAALFYQPLLYVLVRRIDDLSDEIADDYAVQHGASRQQYARRLVSIAEHYLPARAETVAGLGVVSLRSTLGRRVQRILDSTRALSLRAGAPATAAVAFLGLCAAGAAGTVAIGTVATEPAEKAAATTPDRWKWTSTDGYQVELVAVSSDEKEWWRPDGAPTQQPVDDPGNASVTVHEGECPYLFVARCLAPDGGSVWMPVETVPSSGSHAGGSTFSSSPPNGERPQEKPYNWRHHMTTMSADLSDCTLRIAVPQGEWKTYFESEGSASMSGEHGGAAFSAPIEADGKTRLVVTHELKDYQVRIQAFGEDGTEYWGESGGSSGAGGFKQLTVAFDAPAARIKLFRLQKRAYEWHDFKNVALRPQEARTDAEEHQPVATPRAANRSRAATPDGINAGAVDETAATVTAKGPAPIQDGPWTHTFSTGTTLELVAVSLQGDEESWWTPDGKPTATPLKEVPIGLAAEAGANEQACRFFLRYEYEGEEPGAIHLGTVPPGSSNGSSTNDSPNEKNALHLSVLPVGLEACSLRVGVPAGEWKTVASFSGWGDGGASIGNEHGGFVLTNPTEREGNTQITLTHEVKDRYVRIVAIDVAGKLHTVARKAGGGSVGNILQETVEFRLPLEQIASIQAQTRGWEWHEFQNVPLYNG